MPKGIWNDKEKQKLHAIKNLGKLDVGLGHCRLHTVPTIHPTTKNIAWAAGIYEGEGSCCGDTCKLGIRIRVAQKDPWILWRLKELFGGSVYKEAWGIDGMHARGFAMTIFTLLSPRRQEQINKFLRKNGNGKTK